MTQPRSSEDTSNLLIEQDIVDVEKEEETKDPGYLIQPEFGALTGTVVPTLDEDGWVIDLGKKMEYAFLHIISSTPLKVIRHSVGYYLYLNLLASTVIVLR